MASKNTYIVMTQSDGDSPQATPSYGTRIGQGVGTRSKAEAKREHPGQDEDKRQSTTYGIAPSAKQFDFPLLSEEGAITTEARVPIDADNHPSVRPLQTVQSSSTIASIRDQSRTPSTDSTNSSRPETTEPVLKDIDVAGGEDGRVVDATAEAIKNAEASVATPDLYALAEMKEDGHKKSTETRAERPALESTRTRSFFDMKEGDSTPRRWRRRMDRNALANPGASVYTPNAA